MVWIKKTSPLAAEGIGHFLRHDAWHQFLQTQDPHLHRSIHGLIR
jgi:hypothetical protein